ELTTALLNTPPADTTLNITDITSPPIPTRASKHASCVASIQTDLPSRTAVDSLIDSGASPPRRYDVVYILHGIMSSGSESNFDLGMNVNLFATQYILDRLRRTMPGVKIVYTSSLAVYGPTAPGFVITERNMPQMPTSSYGMEKRVQKMLDVLEMVGGTKKRALVEEKPDEDVNRIVQGWSPNFDTAWAKSLGFYEDMSLLDSVQRFVSESLK
ncbi:nucleoside-diphosphate-sugar epimerase, partial [Histoplasma capsulatum]